MATESRVGAFNTKRNKILHGAIAGEKDAKAILRLARDILPELRAAETKLRKKYARRKRQPT